MAEPGPWVERWLSAPRFNAYLDRCVGDRRAAIELYEWNAHLSAAFMHDLGHLEVGLRNAYDAAIQARRPRPEVSWVFEGEVLFPEQPATADDGTEFDRNAKSRQALTDAAARAVNDELQRERRRARAARRPPMPVLVPSAGHVVATLTFGFWRYMTTSHNEKTLWVPYLHHAFAAGTDRKVIDKAMASLNDWRNRVAHHETLSLTRAHSAHSRILELADLVDSELRAHILARSSCPRLLASCPETLLPRSAP